MSSIGPGRQHEMAASRWWTAQTQRYQIGVLRDPASRGGSKAMHESVGEGDTLQISVPRNHFSLVQDAPQHLLIAGGIGVTPILCMAEQLARSGAEFEMHYCTRSREGTAFLDRIERAAFARQVTHHFSRGAQGRPDVATFLAAASADCHLYVCGPKGFMDAVLGEARRQGWPEERLHHEFFSAEVQRSATDPGFDVRLASSGQVILVRPEQTVLEALQGAGIEILSSCEQGVCGTCLTRVLEGTPDHRDSYLTVEEQAQNDQFLPCCSRARSALLVLDL